jgi:hypothetical protein
MPSGKPSASAARATEKREVGNVVCGDWNMLEILTPALDHPGICGKMRRFSNPASGQRFPASAARGTRPSSQTLLL